MLIDSSFIFSGIAFGLTAGFAPGPLTVLTIQQTLQHDLKEGLKVASAPLFTDLPILTVALLAISYVSQVSKAYGVIWILGGFFLAYLAYGNFSARGLAIGDRQVKPHSIKKGILTNLVNPPAYLFWFTVGAPTATRGFATSLGTGLSFLLVFFVFIVGSKLLLAATVRAFHQFTGGKAYLLILRALGVVMAAFALQFFWRGLTELGVLGGHL